MQIPFPDEAHGMEPHDPEGPRLEWDADDIDSMEEREFSVKFIFPVGQARSGAGGTNGGSSSAVAPFDTASQGLYSATSISGISTPPPSTIADDCSTAETGTGAGEDNDVLPPPYDETSSSQPPIHFPRGMNVAILTGGHKSETRHLADLGAHLRSRHGFRVRFAAVQEHAPLASTRGLEFVCMPTNPEKSTGSGTGWQFLEQGMGQKTLLQCWGACVGDGTKGSDEVQMPFVADLIIASPWALGAVHCAEALGVPIHIMSATSWAPERSWLSRLSSIRKEDLSSGVGTMLSSALIDLMLWHKTEKSINRFREQLNLDPIRGELSQSILNRERIPVTYFSGPYVKKGSKPLPPHLTITDPSREVESAAEALYNGLDATDEKFRCALAPDYIACLRSKKGPRFGLSAIAAQALIKQGVLKPENLEHLRTRANAFASPSDPLSGLAIATSFAVGDILTGATALPREAYNQARKAAAAAPATPIGDIKIDPTKIDMNSEAARSIALSTGKGISNIMGAGLKTPMTMTHGLARGFHNLPKLYGDDTVREEERVTGWKTGFVTAGKGFGQGLYDGLTGFVTQPIQGAQKEGGVGFLKGFGKGVGGLVCKPAAGACGVPGYAFLGLYRELHKVGKPDTAAYIVAARLVQGELEMHQISDAEKVDIISRWFALQVEDAEK